MSEISRAAWRRSFASFAFWLGAVLALVALVAGLALASCAPGDGTSSASDAYGGALNHTHDLLALRGVAHTVLLATHIGLYRTTNSGQTWLEVAGGAGQPIDGLMLYKLAQSPVDAQRVYVLAIPRTAAPAPAKPGLYTSNDAGIHWRLATPLTIFPNSAVFTVSAGASAPGEVFAIDSTQGIHGLYVSQDSGAHWQVAPPLPTSDPSGLLDDPTHPGRLLLWSRSTGLYESQNNGQSWAPAPGVQGAVYAVSRAGAIIYAPGDQGLFVSMDDGASFHLVDQLDTFTAVLASDQAPQDAYALGGTTIYTTTDAGHTWRPTSATSQHPGALTVDPANAAVAYVGFSYPLGVARTTNAGKQWRDVLP
ncbi:MAG TPA: hypothetical protein VKQ36_16035 [Ktedonobacterales bacterium]|nr:hypothetical protein [Ktedonobacterales bacterium]